MVLQGTPVLELLRAAGVPQAGFPVLPTVAHERLSKNVMGTQGTHVVTYYTHMHTDLHTHRWTRVHTLTQMDTPLHCHQLCAKESRVERGSFEDFSLLGAMSSRRQTGAQETRSR